MYVPAEDGSWVNEKTARIAELIQQYDHRLELRWIRPDQRVPGEPEFAVIEKSDDGREYVAFLIQNEDFVDERLLGRIYAADNKDKNVGDEAEAHNRAVRAVVEQEKRDEDAAVKDLALSMLKSQLHTYRHNGRKIDL
jgi:hypothetical protein